MKGLKNCFAFIFLIMIAFCFCSCGEVEIIDEVNENEPNITMQFDSWLDSEKEECNVEAYYDDSLFEKDATKFDKDIVMLSYMMSLYGDNCYRCEGGAYVAEFFSKIGFDNFYISPVFREGSSEQSIGFVIASKRIVEKSSNKSFDIVAICVRGFDYGLEWVNNFAVGQCGNHSGFDECANKVLLQFNEYISNLQSENIKLWISGYSRGGAVANVLASKILSVDKWADDKSNIFVYTFDAPRGLTKANAVAYENVFNIVNLSSPVAYFAPSKYGLYRCGIDIDIYTDDLIDILEESGSVKLPKFKKTWEYESPKEFAQFLYKAIFKSRSSSIFVSKKDLIDISTRENYYNNLENTIKYAINFWFSMSYSTKSNILNAISDMSVLDYIGLINADRLYNFLVPFIENDNNLNYNDEELKFHINTIINFALSNEELIRDLKDVITNVVFMVSMHFPDTNYYLLKHYLTTI